MTNSRLRQKLLNPLTPQFRQLSLKRDVPLHASIIYLFCFGSLDISPTVFRRRIQCFSLMTVIRQF